MKISKKILSILLVASALLGAAAHHAISDIDNMYTAGFLNGRGWLAFPDHYSKGCWIMGHREGRACIAILLNADEDKIREIAFPDRSTTAEEIVQMIDDFYSVAANAAIPVIAAYNYAIKKVRGASSEELETFESDLRRNNISEEP